jgi:hypothetical protein
MPLDAAFITDNIKTKIYNGGLGIAKSHDTSAAAYTNKHKLYTYNRVKISGFHACIISFNISMFLTKLL